MSASTHHSSTIPTNTTLTGPQRPPPATTSDWTSTTFTGSTDLVVRSGNTPPRPAPDHDTDQCAVTTAWNTPPASPTDGRSKVCPQSGEAAYGSESGPYGVPGPRHTTTADPSPNSHTAEVGVATASTTTPGTSAVDRTGVQTDRSTHSHDGTPTTCRAVSTGDILTTGFGSCSCATALAASAAGSTTGSGV
ncbi:hypothetical protein [Kitasatospora sp. MAP5-34]|uniref:hypothetical protein n=1 Tax=Kitasatospora sp. MAP5-34 TaxID=3035102 RepID=UPI00247306BB|nr:hypothetical protein [Kitasatospora sp. MAP5-34]MDH6579403.1 hypothetical protein [Kitasatospora sp. MAP5-34]